ncbi:MAG: rhomboid family intramembrane serine protease [Salinigranum sp.]
MAKCDECGKYENLPYQCRRCGGTFCAEHRLPENHDCPGLNQWDDPSGVFDSGFDDSVDNRGRAGTGIVDRITGTGGLMGYVRGNVAYTFLALMWITFALQLLLQILGMPRLGATLFVLRSTHIEYVWTWFTAIFAHGGFMHIFFNSIVLYFFGPLVERYIGSKKFAALFLVAGAASGLGQVLTSMLLAPGVPSGVIGASGAIMAVLGVLTVLNPSLRIYLYFLIPIPLWLFTLGFAAISVLFFVSPGAASAAGMGNVANLAHLVGLVIGLAYGQRIKGRHRVPGQLQFGGGGAGGPGRGRF